MNKILVQTSHDSCLPFKKRRIVEVLMDEAEVKESEAFKIARSIERKMKGLNENVISSAAIREEVNAQLRKRGMMDEARKHERVGIPAAEIKKTIGSHNTDNANVGRNPEAVHKYVADAALKQYALGCLPTDLARAHEKGDLHCHDLEFFPARPLNCLQQDLRQFIQHGLKVDGNGEHTSAAGPANNIETLVNHAGQILMASQVFMSGGQSLPLMNVFMAPYVRGLDYERIKQAMQMLIFNLNMSYVSRGGQTVFSSVNLEFGVPKFIENEIAWGPGGEQVGVYGDYFDEAELLRHAFTDVLLDGDSMGKPHLFPNTIYAIREESLKPEHDDAFIQVHELSAKYSTPYFTSLLNDYSGVNSNTMGCRTRLNTNWTGDWDKDTLRTGNLAYITLNLPRMVYKGGNFYENLEETLGLAERLLLIRREHALKCMGPFNLLAFLTQMVGDEPYYRIENSTLSFGFVGMHETLLAMGIEDGIVSKEGQKTASDILKFMNAYKDELIDETDYRWTVLQTPAESTAHRFATLDKRMFKDVAIVNGNDGNEYYTNSTHVPVDSNVNLFDKIKIEEQYHPLTSGGHITNLFIGESYPGVEALSKLTKRVAQKTDTGFYTYSSAFSYCFGCNHYMRGLKQRCDACGNLDGVEWYDRITGYIQAVGHKKDATGGWNAGKKEELSDRNRFEV